MQQQFTIKRQHSEDFSEKFSDALYHIFLFEGVGTAVIDFAGYKFSGKTVLFTSPYQNIRIVAESRFEVENLAFHGDFYCIEYHKNEVACNGLLFNNIYLFPTVPLQNSVFAELKEIFQKIENANQSEPFSQSVLKSYLQLILAISSREKSKILAEENVETKDFDELKTFQNLVEEYYLTEKSPSFYAEKLGISPNTLSKKIKAEFGKTPSQIIQERVILEAKKLIHLTRKSIKEIAAELNFEDEFYFSKYFKKYSGVSPTQFRDEVGISEMAD